MLKLQKLLIHGHSRSLYSFWMEEGCECLSGACLRIHMWIYIHEHKNKKKTCTLVFLSQFHLSPRYSISTITLECGINLFLNNFWKHYRQQYFLCIHRNLFFPLTFLFLLGHIHRAVVHLSLCLTLALTQP